MNQLRQQEIDISTEPIDPDLKACVLPKLWSQPSSRVVKRGGQLFFQSCRFEISCERLCADGRFARAR
jgi:hypothetical protein